MTSNIRIPEPTIHAQNPSTDKVVFYGVIMTCTFSTKKWNDPLVSKKNDNRHMNIKQSLLPSKASDYQPSAQATRSPRPVTFRHHGALNLHASLLSSCAQEHTPHLPEHTMPPHFSHPRIHQLHNHAHESQAPNLCATRPLPQNHPRNRNLYDKRPYNRAAPSSKHTAHHPRSRHRAYSIYFPRTLLRFYTEILPITDARRRRHRTVHRQLTICNQERESRFMDILFLGRIRSRRWRSRKTSSNRTRLQIPSHSILARSRRKTA